MNKLGIWAIAIAGAFLIGVLSANPVVEAVGGWKAAFDDLQQQIFDIELTPGPQGETGPQGEPGESLSCPNQRAIANEIFEFIVDPECIIGFDVGIIMEGPGTLGINIITLTVTNFGPDPFDTGVVDLDTQQNVLTNPIPAVCNQISIRSLSCPVPLLLLGDSFSFQYGVDVTASQPGNCITVAQVTPDNIEPFNERNNDHPNGACVQLAP